MVKVKQKALFFCLAAWTIFVHAEEFPLGTGLVPPTPQEQAWDRAHLIQAQRIRLNRMGWDRVNAHRRSLGQQPLSVPAGVAPLGQEVDGMTRDDMDRRGVPSVPAEAPSDLPAVVDNAALKYFPPIRHQGGLGSCAQWTAIYYCFTHMNALVRDLDAKNGTDAVRFSPKFTYNFLNGGQNVGTWPTSGWAIVSVHGAASWQEWPYDSDYRAWPRTAALYRNALNVRVDRTGYIRSCGTASGMSELKTMLANGYVLSFATYVLNWQFKTISNDPSTTEDDTFVGKEACYFVNGTSGGHGMTVVGYNDHIWVDINSNGLLDPGEKGAYRIANSYGTGWKDGGYTWLAYDALKTVSDVAGGPSSGRQPAWWSSEAMWVTAKHTYTPTVLAEITLNHTKRNQIGVSFGISSTTETTPSSLWLPASVLLYSGGAYSFSGNTSAEDGTFVFDLSSLPAPAGTTKRWYLRHQDNGAGDPSLLKSFKWINVADSAEVLRGGLPASIENAFAYYPVDAAVTSGAENTPPTLSDIASLSVNEDNATSALTFTVGDTQTAAGSLVVTGNSGNISLVPNNNVVLSGTGATRAVVITPSPDKFGSALITLRVTDAGGLYTEKSFTLTVNPVNDRPVAQAQAVFTPLNTSKTIVLTGTDVDLQTLTFSPQTPVRGALSGTPPSVVYTPPTGFVGVDTFTFTASDGLQTSVAASVTVRIDTSAPTITITNPVSAQTVSQFVDVWTTATDDASVGRVDFFVDGSSIGSVGSFPYRLSWNSRSVSNGSHSLTARAYDSAGNSTLSTAVSITVSNSGTTTILASPSTIHFDAQKGGDPVPPRPVTVSDASGAGNSFLWTVSSDRPWLAASPSSGSGSGIVSVGVDVSDLSVGSYSGTVTFSDGATASLSIPVTLTLEDGSDQTAPSVPGALSAAVTGARVILSWRPSNDEGGSGLAGYRLYRNSVVVAEPIETHYTDSEVTAGTTYAYSIQAEDNAGNLSSVSDSVSVTVSENDSTGGARALSYPEPAVNGAAPVIRAILENASGVEITVYDPNGHVVHAARMDAPNAAVDGRAAFDYLWTGDIPSGVYYAVVTNSEGDKKVRAKTKITVVR